MIDSLNQIFEFIHSDIYIKISHVYFQWQPFRSSQSSKSVIRRVSKQVAFDFAERTLARCRKFEDTGRSCFAEPALQDVLLSAPPSKNNNAKSTNCVGSRTASNTHNESHNQKPELRGSGIPFTYAFHYVSTLLACPGWLSSL